MPMRELLSAYRYLIPFCKSPFQAMQTLPKMNWASIALFLASIAAVSGVLQGLLAWRFFDIFVGLFLFPIFALIINSIFVACIVIGAQIIFDQTLNWQRTSEVVTYSSMAYLILHPFSAWLGIFDLIGMGLQCLLMTSGMTSDLGIDRKHSHQLIAIIYGLFFLIWLANRSIWS
jgi:hypothetical protein